MNTFETEYHFLAFLVNAQKRSEKSGDKVITLWLLCSNNNIFISNFSAAQNFLLSLDNSYFVFLYMFT